MDHLKQFARMCTLNFCGECPFKKAQGEEEFCLEYILNNTEEAKKIIVEWAENHPEKTRKQDFLEKYPDALLRLNDGTPLACCKQLGYIKVCNNSCEKCWEQPV